MIKTLIKHARNFTKEDNERAKYINYYDDGSLFMTDSIIGIYAQTVHTETAHIRNVNNRKVEGSGISQDKVYQLLGDVDVVENNAAVVCNLEVENLLSYVQTVNKIRDDSETKNELVFEANTTGILVKARDSDFTSVYHDRETSFAELYTFALDAKRLEQVLQLITDVGYDDMKMFYRGLAHPIEFRSYDGKLRAVIMQLRLYQKI